MSLSIPLNLSKISKKPVPDVMEVGNIISRLQHGETLEEKYVGHPLSGNW